MARWAITRGSRQSSSCIMALALCYLTTIVPVYALGPGNRSNHEREQLMLDKMIASALERNPQILAATHKVEAARHRLYESIRSWFPTLTVHLDSSFYKRDNANTSSGASIEIVPGISIPSTILNSTGQEYFQSRAGLRLEQLLWDDGKVGALIRRAAATLHAEEVEHAATQQDVVKKVTEVFYALLETDAEVAVLTLELELAKHRRQQVKKGFIKRKLATIEASLTCAERTDDLAQKKEEKIDQIAQLLSLTGHPPSDNRHFTLERPHPTVGAFPLPAAYPRITVAIQRAKAKRALLTAEQDVNRSGRRWRGEFFAGLDYFKTNREWGKTLRDVDRSWTAGVRFAWPLYDQGKSVARIHATASQLDEVEINLATIREELRQEIHRLRTRLERQQRIRSLLQEKRTLMHAQMKQIDRSRASGLTAYQDVLIKQIEIKQTERAILASEKTIALATLDLARLGREKGHNDLSQ